MSEDKDKGGIRAVSRALRLLHLMNQSYASSLHELHRLSGLPKPTVFRILATLQAEGYVEAEGGGQGVYRVAAKVQELSAGYNEKTLVVDVAAPIMLEVTRRLKWPLGLGVLDGAVMAVRYSTMPHSPLAVGVTTLGHRHGLLRSALGQAYLAFTSPEEREILLQLVSERPFDEAERQRIANRLEMVRLQGYGLRRPEKPGDSATVALPILYDGAVVACLSMTTFGKVMNERFLAGYRPDLEEAAAEIATAYAAGVTRISERAG
jgi:IclR family mhp operon transcriptional activator